MPLAPPANLNGKPRKQLSDQLDRLDEIINGLAECLPEAVADVARDGIRHAFRDVAIELMNDPAILERVRAALLPELNKRSTDPKPSGSARLKAWIRNIGTKAALAVTATSESVAANRRRLSKTVADRVATARKHVTGWQSCRCQSSITIVRLGIVLTEATISCTAQHPF